MLNLWAYIDPGTASLVFQILAGVLIVCGVVLGIWWTKISTFFKSVWAKLFKKKNNGGEQSESDEAAKEIEDDEIQEESKESPEISDEQEI